MMHLTRMRRPARAMAVLAAMSLLALAACGSDSDSDSESEGGYGGVTMSIGGFVMPSPVEFGQGTDVFPDEVKFSSLDSGAAALSLIKQGQLAGVVDMSAPPAALALSTGVPIKIIWISSLEQDGLTVSDDIQSAEDLRGKKVGTALGTISEYVLDQYLISNGLKPTDVEKVEVPPSGMASALRTKQISGAYIWAPFFQEMVNVGNGHLLDETTDPAFNVVSADFAEKHPEVVQAFVCDLATAHENLLDDPDAGYEVIGKRINVEADQVRAMMPPEAVAPVNQMTQEFLGTGDGPSDVAVFIHTVTEWLVDNGKVDRAPSLAEVEAAFDTSFAQTVVDGGCE